MGFATRMVEKVVPRPAPDRGLQPGQVWLGSHPYTNAPVRRRLWGHEGTATWLIAGQRGSGKSVAVRCVIADVAGTDAAIVLADPKVADLQAWSHRPTTVALGARGTGVLLRLLWAEKVIRNFAVELEPKRFTREGKIVPSPAMPRLIGVVEELAVYLGAADKDERARAEAILKGLAAEARALQIGLVLITQRPSHSSIPTDLRSQMQIAVGFRLRDKTDTQMVFGHRNVPCDKIPVSLAGRGYVQSESGEEPVELQGRWIPESRIADIDRATAPLRVDLAGWPRRIGQVSLDDRPDHDIVRDAVVARWQQLELDPAALSVLLRQLGLPEDGLTPLQKAASKPRTRTRKATN